jgi:hypothetical protein
LTAPKWLDQDERLLQLFRVESITMSPRVSFRQDDVARAVKGAVSGGIRVARVEISPTDGRIVIVAETYDMSIRTKANPWDSEFEET